MSLQIVRDARGRVQPSPAQPCVTCGHLVMGRYAREDLPPEERRKFRAHEGRGRCAACYHRDRGELDGHEGRWSRDDLVYEWEFLAAQGYSRHDAARRLRVSYAALCKAIERVNRDRATTQSEEDAA